jgi:hypothetical protein
MEMTSTGRAKREEQGKGYKPHDMTNFFLFQQQMQWESLAMTFWHINLESVKCLSDDASSNNSGAINQRDLILVPVPR